MKAPRLAAVLLSLSLILLGWAIVVSVTGGVRVELGPIRVSSRHVLNPLLIAAMLGGMGLVLTRGGRDDVLAASYRSLEWSAPVLAGAVALLILCVGIARGSFVAGGSDSYGYVSQAERWRSGELAEPVPLPEIPASLLAVMARAPLGYAATADRLAIVPVYAPGLPLLMAVFRSVGGEPALFALVPLLGAVLVWLTYAIGARLADRGTGLVACLLLATAPAFVFHVLQPLSDVPAATFWMLAFLLTLRQGRLSALWSGVAASMALVVRPNLVLLAGVLALCHVLRAFDSSGRDEEPNGLASRQARGGFVPVASFLLGLVPGCVLIGWTNWSWFGAPWRSGYGRFEDLYSLGNASVNFLRYPQWIIDTQTPFVLLAFLAPFVWKSRMPSRRCHSPLFALGFATVVWLSYLFYAPFDSWTYLRFLLPALPLLFILSTGVVFHGAERLPRLIAVPLVIGVFAFIVGTDWRKLEDLRVLAVAEGEAKYPILGRYVASTLPQRAVIVGLQHSGSLRHYAHRMTIRWDFIDPASLDSVIDALRREHLEPFFVLEDWEEEEFRGRFGQSSSLGRLDWPPRADWRSRVRVYDPADRARMEEGVAVVTERIP